MAKIKPEIWGGGPLESEAARQTFSFIENEIYKRIHKSAVDSLEAGSWNPATEIYIKSLWALLPNFSGYSEHLYRGISSDHSDIWRAAMDLNANWNPELRTIMQAFDAYDIPIGLPRLRQVPDNIPDTKNGALQDLFNIAWGRTLIWTALSAATDPEPGFMGALWAILLITKKIPELVGIWPAGLIELHVGAFNRYIDKGGKRLKPEFREGLEETFQSILKELEKMRAGSP